MRLAPPARTTLLAALVALTAACSKKEDSTAMPDTMNAPAAAPQPMATPQPRMQAVLDEHAALGPKPIESLTAVEARRQPTPADAVMALLKKENRPTAPDPAVGSVDRNIDAGGRSLSARIYTPKAGAKPFPVVVYYHGGGWVIANKQVYDGGARAISKLAGAIVISADYRKGPENKFPAAHDDAIAIYEWAMKNATSLGGDPKRIALAGESAGGGLAIATAIAARDKKMQMPVAVVSVYPIGGTDTTTASYVENAMAKPLNRAMMSWFFDNYLNGPQDRSNPRVNLVAADLSNLPPTTIINAQIDPLRTDGEMLASRLKAAGNQAEQKTYMSVNHEFFGMGAVLPDAVDAETMAGNALKRAFGS